MEEIRKAFHGIANHLNNIAIVAGTRAEIIKSEDINTMPEESLREELKEAQKVLSNTADYAVTAGKAMHELKKKIYSVLNIDTSKPLSNQEKTP